MIKGVCIKDITYGEDGKYLMFDNLSKPNIGLIGNILRNNLLYGCGSLFNPLEAMTTAMNKISANMNKYNKPIVMNYNGGYHFYDKQREMILESISFEEIEEAISWLNKNREFKQEELYPYLCGILLNTGQFISCNYGQHKYVSAHLLDNDMDITNAIIIGSHPKDESKSYVHFEGEVLEKQIDFLKRNIEKLNNVHKSFFKL